MSIDMVTRAAIALLVFLGLSFLPFTCPLALALASGPTKFGGRVRAIVVRPDNPNIIWVAAATGGLWKTTNAGADWSQADDFLPSLTFSSLTMDPQNANIMYAGTGELFALLQHPDRIPTTFAEIEGLVLRSPMRGAGIIKTTDGGTKWEVIPFTANNPDFYYVNRIAVNPAAPNIVLAATSTGLWRSIDSGASFRPVSSLANLNMLDVRFHPQKFDPPVAVASAYNSGLFRSTDGGASWTQSTPPTGVTIGAGSRTRFELEPSNSQATRWLAAYFKEDESNTECVLLESVNDGIAFNFLNGQSSGITFTRVDGATDTFHNNRLYTGALFVDPLHPSNIVLGGQKLCRSLDGGLNFSQIGRDPDNASVNSSHGDFHAIVEDLAKNSHKIYVGNDGGVARIDTYDTTPVVTNLNVGLGNQQFHAAAKNPLSGVLVGGTQDIGTLRRGTDGVWAPLFGGNPEGDDAMMVATDPTDANYWYYGSSQGFVIRSSDGGQDSPLQETGQGSPVQERIFDCSAMPLADTRTNCPGDTPILLDPSDPNTLYVGCGRLWRTRKAKDICSNITWDAIKPVSTSQLITTMAIPSYNNKVMWLGTIGGSPAFPRRGRELWMTTKLQSLVNLSSNAGNWTEMSGGSGLPDRPVSRVALHPTDPALVYVAFSGWSDSGSHNLWQGVRQTTGRYTWTDISTGLPAGPLFSAIVHPTVNGWIYAGTHAGLYRSNDGGKTWSAILDGRIPRVPISGLSWVDDHRLTVATYGRGVFELDETAHPEHVFPEVVSYSKGGRLRGHTENLALSDERRLISSASSGAVTMEITGHTGFSRSTPLQKAASLVFQLKSFATKPTSANLKIELFDFRHGTYQQVFSGAPSNTDQLISRSPRGSVPDFISTSRELRARVTWAGSSVSTTQIDSARWAIQK